MTSPAITDTKYDPLFDLVRSIGKVTDGGKHKKLTKKIGLLASINFEEATAVANDDLQHNITQLLDTSLQLLDWLAPIEPESYHQARRNFRRVVHVSVMQAVLEPDDQTILQAQQGVSLSRHYGKIKDSVANGSAVLNKSA